MIINHNVDDYHSHNRPGDVSIDYPVTVQEIGSSSIFLVVASKAAMRKLRIWPTLRSWRPAAFSVFPVFQRSLSMEVNEATSALASPCFSCWAGLLLLIGQVA